ncbi:putative Acetyl-CoA synthetase (ADP-forming) alpha and beta chains [Dissulfuribacter thermophilus]|uniref:Putative Acetyl-CoA synthetase (ADP-forming) alpha and beta chains n=1 Tax=Dissulfuribacter thermophilus TaxID=1156395 RepID=A0A1B9F3S6_9BACT|nr:bifunctional acetate--CoA ligase family protein/GNAT family N-acetyltransferase [Dissulfuribacter thermophilus]OCC14578.1 putative Acetyl-CoA synthetase (ADP-forming) alpha and beta chains [Dissulfuribacter thermophilus]
MSVKSLQYLFSPSTIAVLGVNPAPEANSPGNVLIKNLLSTGFRGVIFPISRECESISGLLTYPSLKSLPKKVDLAVLCGEPEEVLEDLDTCGKMGVKSALILANDFRHKVKDPEKYIQTVQSASYRYGIRCLGPNSTGFIRPRHSVHVSTTRPALKPGKLAFLSESATFASAILDYAISKHVGLSAFFSIGSQADVDFGDILDFLAMDPDTKAVVMHVEAIRDGRKFVSAARALSRAKPIVVVKGGRYQASSRYSHTHAGMLAGEDSVYDAVFSRAGIVRVEDALELFHVTEALSKQPSPTGNRLLIITNAGGPAILATDTLIQYGGRLCELSESTINRLDNLLPKYWSRKNPVDCLSDASPELLRQVFEVCMEEHEKDAILVILTPQFATRPKETAEHLVKLSRKAKSSQILACWMGTGDMEKARNFLNKNGIPTFVTPEQAVKSFIYTFRHSYNLSLLHETPSNILEDFMPDLEGVEAIFNRVLSEGRRILTERESKLVLSYYGIESPPIFLVRDKEELREISNKVEFPVGLKIDSPDITHKARIGGIRLHVGKDEIEDAFDWIIKNVRDNRPDARIMGITVQPMIYWDGHEIAIGAKKDATFGTCVLFGTGGRLFETLKDYSVGLPPLNQTLARRLMEQTKIYQYLAHRAYPRPSIKLLEQTLIRFSQLLVDFPQIQEIDINPFYIGEKRGVCLDARIVLDEGLGKRIFMATGPCCPSNLVICPYPCHFIDDAKMKDGTPFLIRPIKPEDEPKMYELFETFSPETILMRFFQPISEIPHEQMVRYCQIDYDREIALVATVNEGEKERFIGVGRLTILPDRESSEFAVVVGDPWQGKGVGKILMKRCLEIARSQGVRMVYMDILRDNFKMRSLAESFGFKKSEVQDELIRYSLDLVDSPLRGRRSKKRRN